VSLYRKKLFLLSGKRTWTLLKRSFQEEASENTKSKQSQMNSFRNFYMLLLALLRQVTNNHGILSSWMIVRCLTDADKAIIVCGDLHLEKFKGYWMIDCAAATENILLAAHSLGLGACWLGLYPREGRVAGMRKLLQLPAHIIPLAVVSLGYPAEIKPKEDRYDQSRVHVNKW
jgi:hypothetical protein